MNHSPLRATVFVLSGLLAGPALARTTGRVGIGTSTPDAQLTPVLLEALRELKAQNDALRQPQQADRAAQQAALQSQQARAEQAEAALHARQTSLEQRLRALEAASGQAAAH